MNIQDVIFKLSFSLLMTMPRSMFSLTETPDLCYVTAVIVGSEFESAKTAGTCQWAAPKRMNPSDLTNSEVIRKRLNFLQLLTK